MPLFAVKAEEIALIDALPVPEHPSTTFDDERYRALIARSFSITADEKRSILESTPKFTQHQVDELFRILEEERQKFSELNARHEARMVRIAEERGQVVMTSVARSQTTQLTNQEKAALVRESIPDLVAPLGGKALSCMRAFLARFADRIEQTGETSIEGTLDDLFSDELRNADLNAQHADCKADPTFIKNTIHPMLSNLRPRTESARYAGGSRHIISLVLDEAKAPRGRVKAQHRFSILIRPDMPPALAAENLRTQILRAAIEGVYAVGVEQCLDRDVLRHFGTIARRIAEDEKPSTNTQRVYLQITGLLATTESIVRLLPGDRIPFLTALFRFELRSRHDPTRAAEYFDAWFIDAAKEIGIEAEADGERAFKDQLTAYGQFSFPEKLLVLKAWLVGDEKRREELSQLMARTSLPSPPKQEPYVIRPGVFDVESAVAACLGSAADGFDLIVDLKTREAVESLQVRGELARLLTPSAVTRS
ncbi:MAG: hypothetical protein JO197_03700 [Acidobacteria bacterium]|nr:hypothetical protein [Acidobacteriota bacterium]MBV9476511.1 hypothetical protein [Acidobacteriota bacterium]